MSDVVAMIRYNDAGQVLVGRIWGVKMFFEALLCLLLVLLIEARLTIVSKRI